MTDLLFQGSTRQAVLDDLALALPLETWIGPFDWGGEDLSMQIMYGGVGIDLGKDPTWQMSMVWLDTYQSGLKDGITLPTPVPETKVARGLHANFRVGGERREEIQDLIQEYIERQPKADRKMPEAVWRARGRTTKPAQVFTTARGTSFLQDEFPAKNGHIKTRSSVFA